MVKMNYKGKIFALFIGDYDNIDRTNKKRSILQADALASDFFMMFKEEAYGGTVSQKG